MKIGIDVSMINKQKAGIGYYAFSLVNAFAEVDKANEYFLLAASTENIQDLKLSSKFNVIEIEGTGNLKWMIKCLPIIKSLKLDHFFSPSNLFWGCVLNNCTTAIHDIGQILHPEFFYKKGNLFYRLELSLLLRRRGIVISPSNSVKEEIKNNYRFIRSKLSVIVDGLNEWSLTKYDDNFKNEVVKKYNLPDKYILSVGTLEPRKNLQNVILGFKEYLIKYKTNEKLVLVGKKGWFYDGIFKTVKDNNLGESVIFLGYVPDSDLPVIYDLSTLVISLSYYEGFGLPLIEANARGKSVLASDIPVYKELNISGLFIDPNSDSQEIAKSISLVNNLGHSPSKYFFDTYSWKETARQTLALWE